MNNLKIAQRCFSTGAYNKVPKEYMNEVNYQEDNKAELVLTMKKQSNFLDTVSTIFEKFNCTPIGINPKPSLMSKDKEAIDLYLDFDKPQEDISLKNAFKEIKQIHGFLNISDILTVPWFPQTISDFDQYNRILRLGDGIEQSEHIAFEDEEYVKRRNYISEVASEYKMDDPELPHIEYNENEKKTWNICYGNIKNLYERGACKEFTEAFAMFEKYCGVSENDIPQLDHISRWLKPITGWRVRPVGGLLSQREYMNGLAFKIFHCTQFLRHHSDPEFSPEPDGVHEILGHTPMLFNKEFSDFSQKIGLASLGCTDHQLSILAAIYIYTVEFGMCMDEGKKKAYGAAILTSIGEFEWAISGKPPYLPFDWAEIAENYLDYLMASVQPYYFLAESFADAKDKINDYVDNMERPFYSVYNEEDEVIEIDRKVRISKREKDPVYRK